MVSTRLSVVAAVAAASLSAFASAELMAGWTVPCAFPTGTGNVPTGTFFKVPLAVNSDGTYNANPNTGGTTWDAAMAGRADSGAKKLQAGFELSSTHQLASSGANATSYTSPAGNGSQYAFGGDGLFGGMSGVVYGLLGFSWVAPMLQPAWRIQPTPALMLFMVGWLVLCMAGLVEVLGFGAIANAAHLGGLICGAVLGALFGLVSGRTNS